MGTHGVFVVGKPGAIRRPDFDEILTRNADAALVEIDRLAGIASSFARFRAPEAAGEAPLETVDLELVVGEVLALYSTGEGGVSFEKEVESGIPPVPSRVAELKEVLVNLLENARAAVRADGEVRVEVRTTPDGVVLKVRDDGVGIPSEIAPRVFEPHFSTRSAGAGLGLAIVKQLVESWDALVGIESPEGGGTLVTIRFSDTRDAAPSTQPGDAVTSGPAQQGITR